MTGSFGSLHYLLLRALWADFTRLEEIFGEVETRIYERRYDGMRRGDAPANMGDSEIHQIGLKSRPGRASGLENLGVG